MVSSRNVRESSTTRDDLYKTPPSSPVVQKKPRAPLQKSDSFDKSETPTPPATPLAQRSERVSTSLVPSPGPSSKDETVVGRHSEPSSLGQQFVDHASLLEAEQMGGVPMGIAARAGEIKPFAKTGVVLKPCGDADGQLSSDARENASKMLGSITDGSLADSKSRSVMAVRYRSPASVPVRDERYQIFCVA